MILATLLLTTTIYLPFVPIQPDGGTAALTMDHCVDLQKIGATWSYQWHPWPHPCEGIEMVPMIWGAESYSPTAAPSPYLLGPNEPNRPKPEGSNMSPQEAAVFWHSKIERDYPWRIKGSPAATEVKWTREWRLAYVLMYNKEPDMGFITGHIYRTSLEDARATLADWVQLSREWGLPLWITEYAFPPCFVSYNSRLALQMSIEFTRLLRQTDEVSRFAWFGSRLDPLPDWYSWPATCNTGLFDMYGAPTEFGAWFMMRGMM